MRKIDFEIQYHAGNSDICRLKGLDISQLPECEGGSFTLPRAQAEYLAGLRAENERLEAEVKRLSRLATDNAYMRDAYHAMLMPNGLKVAAMWKAQGVQRQHTSWGDNAWLLNGEERAQCILDWETLPRREVLPGELDGPALSEAQP